MRAEHEGRTWSIVLDLGNGALGPLQRHIEPYAVDAVLLSHLHVDHCIDMCGLYVMMQLRPRRARARDDARPGARPAPAPTSPAPTATATPRTSSASSTSTTCATASPSPSGPFTITPVRVNHPVEAYGFRVEAGGRVLAYTGDTDTCDAARPTS